MLTSIQNKSLLLTTARVRSSYAFIFNRLHDVHLVTLRRDPRRLGRLGRSDHVKIIKRTSRSEISRFKPRVGNWNRHKFNVCRDSRVIQSLAKKLIAYLSHVNRHATNSDKVRIPDMIVHKWHPCLHYFNKYLPNKIHLF